MKGEGRSISEGKANSTNASAFSRRIRIHDRWESGVSAKTMTNRVFSIFLGILLVFCLSGTMASSQNQVIVSLKVGECDLRVESIERERILRLRAHHPTYEGCRIDKSSMVSVLTAAFLKNDSPKIEGNYSSVSIGRLIDYPWLSQYLATTAYHDQGWDSRKGKPVTMDINQYVSQLLSRKELLAQIETPFAKGGYKVNRASVEKVLVGGFREVPFYQGKMYPGRVPYDAQVWFRLAKN